VAPSLASVADLAAWVGESIEDEDPRATAFLHAASTLVRSFAGRTGVDDWPTLADVPDDAHTVTLLVAARLWANPSSASQESETLGTYAHSASYRADGLYLSRVEKTMLEHYRTRSGLWVQPTTRGDLAAENDTVFAPVTGGGESIPMITEYPS
jgi:hypothetical protein